MSGGRQAWHGMVGMIDGYIVPKGGGRPCCADAMGSAGRVCMRGIQHMDIRPRITGIRMLVIRGVIEIIITYECVLSCDVMRCD